MLKGLACRLAAIVVAAATIVTSLGSSPPIATADLSNPSIYSPNTQTYCDGAYYCTLSVDSHYTPEGTPIPGQLRMRPNYTAKLRAFEVLRDSGGRPVGLKPVGPVFEVTTDDIGRADFTVPTAPLVAPSTGGGHKFLVQASDFSLTNLQREGVFDHYGTWPYLAIRSARAQHMTTVTQYPFEGSPNPGDPYFKTTLEYGIPGHVFQAQAQVSGRWMSVNMPGVSNNGIVDPYGTVTLTWDAPSTLGAGIYPLRIINITKNEVVYESSLGLYDPPTGVWGDHDGDKKADILAVDTRGSLRMYITRGGPSLSSLYVIGGGWGAMTWVATLPDMDGNGYSEMLARRNDGTMWLYRGTNFGAYGSAKQVGKGWNGLDQLTILPDINGDKQPEMLARNAAGKLLRYKVTLNGAQYVNEIGSGWGSIIKVISLGDMTRDGVADFVAIAANGNLYRYALNRSGKVTSTAHVGRYWQSMSQAFSPGDMDGDGIRDLVARREDGKLFFYKNYGNGSFGAAKAIGSGWNGIRLFT